jgi:hypothetical protein
MLVNHKTKLLLLLCLALVSLDVRADLQSRGVKKVPGFVQYKDTTPFARERANKSGEYDEDMIVDLTARAVKQGVDPWIVLGTAMKETNLGKADPYNPMQVSYIHGPRVSKKVLAHPEFLRAHAEYDDLWGQSKETGTLAKIKNWWNNVPERLSAADERLRQAEHIANTDAQKDIGIEIIKESQAKRGGLRHYNWGAPSDVKKTMAYSKDLRKNPRIKEIVDRIAQPNWGY